MELINRFVGTGWWMGWGWIIGLIVLILIIWIVYSFYNRNRKYSTGGKKAAMEVLEERYKRGEIDRAEYESRKKAILGDDQARKHDR